ncbi:MAG: hypothetical protein Q4B09_05590 [Lachnospiraceae bacterium]|nr:hypothetical protein [Lachnospiraceae bacterium]
MTHRSRIFSSTHSFSSFISASVSKAALALCTFLLAGCCSFLLQTVAVSAGSFECYTYTLAVGIDETLPIDMSLSYPNSSVNYWINDTSLADCEWGHWHGNNVALYVTGRKTGATQIKLTNSADSTTYVINVAVGRTSSDRDRLLNLAAAYTAYKYYVEDSKTEGYYLYDMNLDGIPELITRQGEYSADEEYHFYSYNDGIEYAGVLTINHCAFYANGYGGLALCRRYMGTTSRYDLTLDRYYEVQYSTVFSNVFKEPDTPDKLYNFNDNRYTLTEYSRGDISSFNNAFYGYGYSA